MTKTINAYKLRTNLGEYLDEVYYKGYEVIVERRGKALVKIIRIEDVSDESIEKRRVKLLSLAGSLSPKRAEEMKRLIYKTRKLNKRRIVL